MDEFTSAEKALVVLHNVVDKIGRDDRHRLTPCRDWDVEALAEHLVDTISGLGAAAGIEPTVPDGDSIDQRIQQVTQPILAGWRRRGLTDDVVFSGRTLPAQLALGILCLELVVHGWDFAVALHRPLRRLGRPRRLRPRPLRGRPSPRKVAPPPGSIQPCRCPLRVARTDFPAGCPHGTRRVSVRSAGYRRRPAVQYPPGRPDRWRLG